MTLTGRLVTFIIVGALCAGKEMPLTQKAHQAREYVVSVYKPASAKTETAFGRSCRNSATDEVISQMKG